VKGRASGKAAAPAQAQTNDEDAFLDAYDPAAYERPSVAVDVAVVTVAEGALRTLLVRRSAHPFRGRWALPGGFVGVRESLDRAAARVLADKAKLREVFLEQLYTFGEPGRDPRTRVISVAYYALVEPGRLAASDASESAGGGGGPIIAELRVPWEGESGGPVEARSLAGEALPLAFDHAQVLGLAVKRMRGKLDYAPIGFQLLPPTFTLLELQRVHETVLGRAQNKDSFRRRMLASGLLAATGKMQAGVEHRPAELYRFLRRSAV
jgi:8-oxo-dGTP diphosphatase